MNAHNLWLLFRQDLTIALRNAKEVREMLFGLEWYWWILIAIVVVAGGYVKLKLLKKMMATKNETIEED
ncbi:MAG: hypothetical protein FH749_06215 [Firmicutes bacterium]|nr:hypothetical protein [Bacillota bacterium]